MAPAAKMAAIQKNKEGQQHFSISCPEQRLATLIAEAKTSFDDIFAALKSELVHYLLFSERELLAGPKHAPRQGFSNWGYQGGSVYVAGQKMRVKKPRLRKGDKEVSLPLYEALSERSRFSEEILLKALSGISCRDYEGALGGRSKSLGSPNQAYLATSNKPHWLSSKRCRSAP